LRAAEKDYPTAFAFRRVLQKTLPSHLAEFPDGNPLARADFARHAAFPPDLESRWPRHKGQFVDGNAVILSALPIDHSVPSCDIRGGHTAARKRLLEF
jgi:deoxyribodipyrimidine photo-lyase